MRKFKIILTIALALALLIAGGCNQFKGMLDGTSPTPSYGLPVPSFTVTSRSHLRDLLNFADPNSIKLFSLGSNAWNNGNYNLEFNNQYKLVDDEKCTDGKAVEIFIDSGTNANRIHDLVQIDVSAMGITLDEIGEIYVDYMMMDGDQLNNWWPRITLNDNESGTFDGNTIASWRADGASNYASYNGDMNYALITREEIVSHFGTDLHPYDVLTKIGFQFYAAYGQHATFRIDSITILTVDEVAARG